MHTPEPKWQLLLDNYPPAYGHLFLQYNAAHMVVSITVAHRWPLADALNVSVLEVPVYKADAVWRIKELKKSSK